MSWELASFAVLGVALVAGFTWYERSHPTAKVLALVATLAALAALGRIAFAPIPSVKPTTDLVLLSGYALGGAPGFAVGAIAALTSNLFFGQGPWTPWQMGAWGMTGVLGAALAAVAGRGLGRWPLAIACAAAGLLYGAILDFSVWVTFSGQQTLGQYLVITGGSMPFNIAHAAGNLAFCLLFGPAFVRALARFRDRLDVRWEAAPAAACALVAVSVAIAVLPAPAAHAATDRAAARAGATFLSGVSAGSGGAAADALVALRASGRLTTAQARRRAAALRRGAPSYARTAGAAAKVALGLVASGSGNPRCAGKLDLLARMNSLSRRGRYGSTAWDQSLSVLAIRALGFRPPPAAVQALRGARGSGGWNFTLSRSGRDDVTHTGIAIVALRAAGVPSSDGGLRAAMRWLRAQRTRGGGFALGRRDRNEANSTALAILAARAMGSRDTRAARALKGLQRSGGAFQFTATDSGSRVMASVDAVVALSGATLPVAARSRPAGRC